MTPRPAGARRGQAALVALMAISFAVLVVVGLLLARSGAEREAREGRLLSESAREALVKLERRTDALLRDSVQEAALEMGAHGGYTAEGVPELSHFGVPYLFYRGKVVNLPSVEAMEGMLAGEVRRRLEAKLAPVRRELEGTVSIAAPKVRINLTDDSVTAALELPSTVRGEAAARAVVPVTATLPLRLKRLRDEAEGYVRRYAAERRMESSVLYSMTNDPRIASPGGVGLATIPCEGRTVLATHDQLISPVRESAQLAVSLELNRALANASEGMVEWDAQLNPREVELSFVANAGEVGYESASTILLIPVPSPAVDARSGLCISRYSVRYEVGFPVRLAARDLAPASRVVGADGSAAVRPLELAFYAMPLLAGEDAHAVDASVAAPETVDESCRGACLVDLTVTNADEGSVWLDSCPYRFSGGRLKAEGTPCGRLTLVVEPEDGSALASHVEEVSIVGSLRSEVALSPYSTVAGHVLGRRRALCSLSGSVRQEPPEPLGALEGGSAPGVEVVLVPLSAGLERRRAAVDELGGYEVPFVVPGRYLVMALPPRDASGAPLLDAEAAGLVRNVTAGANRVDLELEPLGLARVGDEYVGVTSTEEC